MVGLPTRQQSLPESYATFGAPIGQEHGFIWECRHLGLDSMRISFCRLGYCVHTSAGAAWLGGRILASHLGWQREGNLVALVTPFRLCWPLSCLPYVDVWPGLSGTGPLWDVGQRVSGPRASVGFKNPPKQELVVLFGIVIADESSWPLTNSPWQEASKIATNFLYFFCLQESLHCNEGAI